MTFPGFKVALIQFFGIKPNCLHFVIQIGVFLGYLEVLGVTICSYGERLYYADYARRAPWTTYFALCLCLLVSSGTSNLALSYINYPTKVVFRSCKVGCVFI